MFLCVRAAMPLVDRAKVQAWQSARNIQAESHSHSTNGKDERYNKNKTEIPNLPTVYSSSSV